MTLSPLARFASVDKMAYLESEESEPDTIHRYRVVVGDRKVVVAFIVTKEGRVYGIGQREETP